MAAYNQEEVVTQAPALPQPTAPAPVIHTAGRGGVQIPVLQAGYGRGAAVAPSPKISGAAPIVPPAAQAGPGPGTTLPATVAEVLPPGIQPYQYGGQATANGQVANYQTGYKFLDPNTGREAGFPTLQAAQAALTGAGTPQGVDQAKAGLLERIRQVDGDPSQTNEAENLLLAPPAALPPTAVAPALNAGAPQASAGGSGVDALDQMLQTELRDLVAQGGPTTRTSSVLQDMYQLSLLKGKMADGAEKLPTLDNVKGGRAQELTRNPGGINEADQLLFAPKGQGEKPQIYKQPIYNQDGFQTGETPYAVDNRGNATPLNLGESQQPEGRPADYPDAYQAVKPDGKMGWFVKRKGKTFLVSK